MEKINKEFNRIVLKTDRSNLQIAKEEQFFE